MNGINFLLKNYDIDIEFSKKDIKISDKLYNYKEIKENFNLIVDVFYKNFLCKNFSKIRTDNLKEILNVITEIEDQEIGQITELWLETILGNIDILSLPILPSDLLRGAKHCAKKNPQFIIDNISKFHSIKDHWFELAKICAENAPEVLIENIGSFQVEDPQKLLELVKICAKTKPEEVARHIRRLNIEDQDELFAIAILCAEKDAKLLANVIRYFNIQDAQKMLLITKRCAEKDLESVAYNIQDFVQDPTTLLDLAKEWVKENPAIIARNIEQFDIQDPEELLAIAKICLAQSLKDFAENIHKFKIQDSDQLIAFLKICAANSDAAKGVTQNIGKLNIQDQQVLISLAELCAKHDPRSLAMNIKNFHIQDFEALSNLATLCAEDSSDALPPNIKNFQIQDQKKRSDLAKHYAERNAEILISHIEKFEIQDQQSLIDLAKLCATQNPEMLWKNLKQFKIKDNNEVNCILALCLIANLSLLPNIANHFFKIHSKDDVISNDEIKKYLNENFFNTMDVLKDIVSEYENERSFYPFLFVLIHYFNGDLSSIQWMKDQGMFEAFMYYRSPKQRLKLLFLIDKEKHVQGGIKESQLNIPLLKGLKEIARISEKNLVLKAGIPENWKIETTDAKKKKEIRQQKLKELNMTKSELSKALKLLTELDKSDISIRFKHLFSIQEVQKLVEQCSTINQNEQIQLNDYVETFNKIKKTNKGEIQKFDQELFLEQISLLESIEQLETSTKPETKILRFILTSLEFESQEITSLYTGSWRKILRHGPSFSILIEVLTSLFLESRLLVDEKKEVIKQLIAKNDFQELLSLQAILAMKQLPHPSKNWSQQAEELIRQELPLGDVQNFSLAYHQKFVSSRYPNALMIYALKLSSLKERSAINGLGRYITMILNDTFKNQRYDVKLSSHLSKIHESAPDLLIEWKQDFDQDVMIYSSFGDYHEISFSKWLKKTLSEDPDLSKEVANILPYLLQETQEQPKVKEKSLQKYLLDLLDSKLNKVNVLKKIKKRVNPEGRFAKELETLLTELKNSVTQQNCRIVETDDPIDILLCGTEVMTCQRIHGDPNLNCGLLGYFDGKTRLLGVKNEENGTIISRCIEKILFDSDSNPVLYLEPIYSQPLNESQRDFHAKLLLNAAKLKADKMGIPLVMKDPPLNLTSVIPYSKTLISLSGSSPFEYSDEVGLCLNGIYEITGASQIISLSN